ncbi:hypothetical protein BDZ97DRAFT_1920853 [Flammula alnicola]|nr:hypothetical protein BDZ97DRAFT_1920853 [Flammula alnicola]
MADENFRANMAAAARNVFGDIPIEFTPTGIRFPGPMGAFGDPRKVRLGQERVQMLLKNEAEGDAFLAKGATDMLSRSIRANLLRCRADKLMKEKQFSQAARLYLESAETYCGAKIPVRHARSKVYMDLDKNWDAQDVMSCFAGAAKALMQMKDYSQALLWLGESQTVYNNIRYDMIRDDPAFDWFDFHLQTSHHYIQVFTMYNTLADAYIKLGNTGASVYYRFQAQVAMSNVPPTVKTSEMDRLLDNAGKELRATSCYRHPEPSLVAKLEVIDKKSHVHGSWAKIELKSPGGLTSRMGCGVFAHESYCYVVGGEKFTGGPYYRDFWRLDLSKMDKWESLSPCPIPESRVDSLAGYKMVVGPDDKAYYFTGSPDVVYFDLKASHGSILGQPSNLT